MERGAGLSRLGRHARATSGLNLVTPNQQNDIDATNVNPNNNENPPNTNVPNRCMIREQDQYMPIANVIRIMRRILPPHAKISDDAKETVQECVSEYISFITGEANERCQREQRKTINAEDVVWAMGKLGFDEYVEPLTLFLARYRESESDKNSSREPTMKRNTDFVHMSMGIPPPLPPMPMPMSMPPLNMSHLSMGPFGQSYQMSSQHNIFDPSAMMGQYYKDTSSGNVGYYRDGSSSGYYRDGLSSSTNYRDGTDLVEGQYKDGLGASVDGSSSSQQVMKNYDPLSEFK